MYPDAKIIELVEAYMHASDHPDQVGYRKQVAHREFADKNLFLAGLKRLAKLGDLKNKRILDVGCGFGWQAFVFSLMGNDLVALDILPSMIDGLTESVATMRAKGVKFKMTGVCGDVCNADLEPGSFDAIYSNEAIEHVHDLPAMFARCYDLLKPGGKIFLLNDSNALHTATRVETMAMWQEREHSWEWVAQLKHWRPVEHGNAKPFAVMREEIVREANPSLPDAAVSEIVTNTAGLLRDQIEDLARKYRPGMNFPEVGELDRCRNPETGEYAERLLDPYGLADLLSKAGFEAQVRHSFRRFPLNLANGIQFRPLNDYLFNLRGSFIIVGQKNQG